MTSNKTWAGVCFGIGLTLLAAALSQWPAARAGVPCTLPFNLQNGTPADATQVMANYQALVTCLGQAAAAGANSDITALTALTTPITPAQGGSVVFAGGTTTGSANTQVLAGTTPTFIPTEGFIIVFTAGFTNTGATTLQVGATPAATVMRKTIFGISPAVGGEIIATQTYGARYHASAAQFELLTMEAHIPGEIRDYAGAVAPPGWFLADGSCRSRTTYSLLFAIISTIYDPTGSTCDVNNFALPDARGRALVGVDTTSTRITVAGSNCSGGTLATACGAQNITLLQAHLPIVNFNINAGSTFSGSGTGTAAAGTFSGSIDSAAVATIPGNTGNTPTGSTSGVMLGSTGGIGANLTPAAAVSGTVSGSTSSDAVSVSVSGSISGSAASGGSGSAVNKLMPLQIVNKIIKF